MGFMKVLLGLSGGVDSAIAAWLLQKQGVDLSCCYMRNWDSLANQDTLGNPTLNEEICPQEQDYLDAKSVADQLGLPLLRMDFIKEYWDEVFQRFLKEYEAGRTPNPDVLCNKYIKFDAFVRFAQSHGFDTIATGHYARIQSDENGVGLYCALDVSKDQTYFLSQVPYGALSKCLFPLGDVDKKQVRLWAGELALKIAKKKDSTGICFIGERNFREFLKNYLPAKAGQVIDIESGAVLQEHQGVMYYTIGQRRGLDIGGSLGPWYVCGKSLEKNELYVTNRLSHPLLSGEKVVVEDFNWLLSKRPQGVFDCEAKFRYRQKNVAVKAEISDKATLHLTVKSASGAIAEGQQAVLYKDGQVLGGGVIAKVYFNHLDRDQWIEEHLYHG